MLAYKQRFSGKRLHHYSYDTLEDYDVGRVSVLSYTSRLKFDYTNYIIHANLFEIKRKTFEGTWQRNFHIKLIIEHTITEE